MNEMCHSVRTPNLWNEKPSLGKAQPELQDPAVPELIPISFMPDKVNSYMETHKMEAAQ